MSSHRALLVTLGVLGVSLAALSGAAITAWTRCGTEGCGPELALGIIALPPAVILISLALLLLRGRERASTIRRAIVAVCVAGAMAPLVLFLVADVQVLGAMSILGALLVYLAQYDPAEAADDAATTPAEAPLGRVRPVAATSEPAGADPALVLRLNIVLEAARAAEAAAPRLQQTSVRIMSSMMRLRRALGDQGAPSFLVPLYLRRDHGDEPAPAPPDGVPNADAFATTPTTLWR